MSETVLDCDLLFYRLDLDIFLKERIDFGFQRYGRMTLAQAMVVVAKSQGARSEQGRNGVWKVEESFAILIFVFLHPP